MTIIANHRWRNKACCDNVIGAKATAVPDADARQMRHHPTFAFVLVKSEAARANHRPRLEHAIFANRHTRIDSHIGFKDCPCTNRSAFHHNATRPNDNVLANNSFDNRRSVDLRRCRNLRRFKNFTTFHKLFHERHHRMVRIFDWAYITHIRQKF